MKDNKRRERDEKKPSKPFYIESTSKGFADCITDKLLGLWKKGK